MRDSGKVPSRLPLERGRDGVTLPWTLTSPRERREPAAQHVRPMPGTGVGQTPWRAGVGSGPPGADSGPTAWDLGGALVQGTHELPDARQALKELHSEPVQVEMLRPEQEAWRALLEKVVPNLN